MASNRSTSGATPPIPGGCGVPSPFRHCRCSRLLAACAGLFRWRGGSCLRPPAHDWATGLQGAVVPLVSLSLGTKEDKTRREGANRPEGSCMRLAPLQAVAQRTGRKNRNNKTITGKYRPRLRPFHWGPTLSRLSHSLTHPPYPFWPRRVAEARAWGPPRCRLSHAAGRRCRALEARRTGAASL